MCSLLAKVWAYEFTMYPLSAIRVYIHKPLILPLISCWSQVVAIHRMPVDIRNLTVDVVNDGCVLIRTGSAIEILDPSLQHRRHIRLPSSLPEDAPSAVDVISGDVYVISSHECLFHVDVGRRIGY